MKIVITGGHLSPLLAVIDSLGKEFEILVIGRKHGFEQDNTVSLEYHIINSLNIPFKSITTGRLQRKFTKHTILSLLKFPFGFLQSLKILKEFCPDAVLGLGGYVSLPVSLAAFLLGIPVVIHEQTLEVGMANRVISLFAKKICISWETSRKFFPSSKTILTGNPLRREIIDVNTRMPEKDLPFIYITGGSSGAHTINVLVEGCVEKLLKNYVVLHQTGDAKKYQDYDRLQRLKQTLENKLKNRYILTKFVEPLEVGSVLRRADLVISRSGINTVTELIFLKKISLLIPLPFSQRDEQRKNALFVKKLGLAEVVDQASITSESLYKTVVGMMENIDKYSKFQEKVDNLVKKDSAERIVEVLRLEVAARFNNKPIG